MIDLFCNFRGRLETNAEQWLRLLTTIQDLLSWILKRQNELRQTQKTLGGDLEAIQRQVGNNQVMNDKMVIFDKSCLKMYEQREVNFENLPL